MDDTGLLLENDKFHCEEIRTSTFPEISLAWCNLSVWVKRKLPGPFWKKSKYENVKLLSNVNGLAKSGTLMAIMGASGAGKTTLLATLSQRMKVGITEGDVLVNGHIIDKHMMNKMSGFAPQMDLAFESLTVIEHMQFMARLKMDREETKMTRDNLIATLLQELGLTRCKMTRLSALSGGERRRTSLATQLLTDPPLLFCDEPTTGLDSYSAASVIEKLKMLAARGKTVICTIHQPASGVFDMFNRVLLLADGRVAYQGDARGAADHFQSLGLICPADYNKAEFYVMNLAVVSGKEQESAIKIKRICDSFDRSKYNEILNEELTLYKRKQSSILTQVNSYEAEASLGRRHLKHCSSSLKVRFHTQLGWLIWRDLINIQRNYFFILVKLAVFLIVSMFIASTYFHITLDQKGIQNLQGMLYLLTTETFFTYSYYVINTFPPELAILLREAGSDLYSPAPYYIAKIITMMPQCLLGGFLFTTIVFFVSDVLTDDFIGFVTLCIPLLIHTCTAAAHGSAISGLFESVTHASIISVPVEFIVISGSGMFLKISNLPTYLKWLPYTSQFYYAVEAVSISQWKEIDHIDCSTNKHLPCLANGTEVLSAYGYTVSHYYWDILALSVMFCTSHTIGFLGIWFRCRKQPVY